MKLTVCIDDVVATLVGDHVLIKEPLCLLIDGFCIHVHSNSDELLDTLRHYFGAMCVDLIKSDIEIIAVQRDALELDIDFVDWLRESHKMDRKDSYVDFDGVRVLRKVRTGMVFLQSESYRIATGPCVANENQVINFINAQYMNWLQHQDWLICHAAALVHNGRTYAFAGFSGGGKSTQMLHLLNAENTAYMTNDRLFIRREKNFTNAAGIPKLPRINPGTIVHNSKLNGLISVQQKKEFLTMPQQDLWELEDKYDVFVDEIYGPDRIVLSAPLEALIILNWQQGNEQPMSIEKVDIAERRDLLPAVMKSPGPFYQRMDGSFSQDSRVPQEQNYIDALQNNTVYEVKGKADFVGLTDYFTTNIFC